MFRAVVEQLEEELGEQVMMAAARSQDAAEQLRLGCMAFLDACLDPAVRRVVLIEAPVVLGWDQWREIDAQHGLSLVTHALEAVVASGQMAPVAIDPLAHLLLGALNEAAMLVAHAPKPNVGEGVEGLWFDAWVHADDIRAAIGRPSEPGPGPPSTSTVDRSHRTCDG